MGPDRSQGAGVFTCQRDEKPSGSNMRGNKRFNGVDGRAVDAPFEIKR